MNKVEPIYFKVMNIRAAILATIKGTVTIKETEKYKIKYFKGIVSLGSCEFESVSLAMSGEFKVSGVLVSVVDRDVDRVVGLNMDWGMGWRWDWGRGTGRGGLKLGLGISN